MAMIAPKDYKGKEGLTSRPEYASTNINDTGTNKIADNLEGLATGEELEGTDYDSYKRKVSQNVPSVINDTDTYKIADNLEGLATGEELEGTDYDSYKRKVSQNVPSVINDTDTYKIADNLEKVDWAAFTPDGAPDSSGPVRTPNYRNYTGPTSLDPNYQGENSENFPIAPDAPEELNDNPLEWAKTRGRAISDFNSEFTEDEILFAYELKYGDEHWEEYKNIPFATVLRWVKQKAIVRRQIENNSRLRLLSQETKDLLEKEALGMLSLRDLDKFEAANKAYNHRDSITSLPYGEGVTAEKNKIYKELLQSAINSGSIPISVTDRIADALSTGAKSIAHSLLYAMVGYYENTGEDVYERRELARQYRELAREVTDSGIVLPSVESTGEQFVYDVIQALPYFAYTMVSTGLGVLAAPFTMGLSMVFPLLMNAVAPFGAKYGELTAPVEEGQSPVSNTNAFRTSLASSLIQSTLDTIGSRFGVGIIGKQGGKEVVKHSLKATAIEAGTEWAQQYPDDFSTIISRGVSKGKSISEIWTDITNAAWETSKSGMYQGLTVAPISLIVGAGKAGNEYYQMTKGKRQGAADSTQETQAKVMAAVEAMDANQTKQVTDSDFSKQVNDEQAIHVSVALSQEVQSDISKAVSETTDASSFADGVNEAAQALDDARLKATSPEGFKAAIVEILKHTNDGRAWVSKDDVLSVMDGKLLDNPDVAAVINSRENSMGCIPVQVADVVALPRSPEREALISILRRTPDSQSVSELTKSWTELAKKTTSKISATAISDTKSIREETGRLTRELRPLVGPDATKKFLHVFSGWATSLYDRFGISAKDSIGRIHVRNAPVSEANGRRASVEFGQDDKGIGHSIITVFSKQADLSSILHEFSHVVLNTYFNLSTMDAKSVIINSVRREAEILGLPTDDNSPIIKAINNSFVDGSIDSGRLLGEFLSLDLPKETILSGELIMKRALARSSNFGRIQSDLAKLCEFAGVEYNGILPEVGSKDYVTLHEAIAKTFEQYVINGKAPSKKLAASFDSFRKWLLNIYKNTPIDEHLTDNVQEFFNRMLATDNEISGNKTFTAVFNNIDNKALIEFTIKDEKLKAQAEAAIEEAEAQVSVIYKKDQDKAERAQAEKIKKEVRKEAEQLKPFKALADLREHKIKIPLSLVQEYLGVDRAAALKKSLPKDITTNGDRTSVIALADALYDGDIGALLSDLHSTLVEKGYTSKRKYVAEVSKQRIEKVRESVKVDPAVYKQDTFIAKVLSLVEQGLVAQGVRGRVLSKSFYANEAKKFFKSIPIQDIDPHAYSQALRKAINQARDEARDLQFAKALATAQKAQLLLARMSEAAKIQEESQKIIKNLGDNAKKIGTLPGLYATALHKLCSALGVKGLKSLGENEYSSTSFRELVTAINAGPGASVDVMAQFPDWLLDLKTEKGEPLSLMNLTQEELRQVDNVQKMIMHMGKEAQKDSKENLKNNVESVAKEAADNLKTLKKKRPTTKFGKLFSQFTSSFFNLMYLFRLADGYKNSMDGKSEKGVIERTVGQSLQECDSAFADRKNTLLTSIASNIERITVIAKNLSKKYGKDFRLTGRDGKQILLPENLQESLGTKSWNAESTFALVLNCGNEGNRARIAAMNLPRETLAQLLGDDMADLIYPDQQNPYTTRCEGIVPREMWEQAADLSKKVTHNLWPDIQKVFQKIFGFLPKAVELSQITIRCNGEYITLDEWYYPIKYDRNASIDVATFTEQDDILERCENFAGKISYKRSFTTERKTKAAGHPLLLTMQPLTSYINEATAFVCYAEEVYFADKVLSHPLFKQAFIEKFGLDFYERFRPNLKGILRVDPQQDSALANISEKLRKYIIPWGLGLNMKVAALQLSALSSGAHDIGATWVMSGLATFTASGGLGAYHEICEASPYMKARFAQFDTDFKHRINEFKLKNIPYSLQIGGKRYSYESLVNAGMLPIQAVDTLCACSIWLGAAKKKATELLDNAPDSVFDINDEKIKKEIIAYADEKARQANPDSMRSSQSAFTRDKAGFERLFNTFCSSVVLYAQRQNYMWNRYKTGQATFVDLSRYEIYENVIPILAIALIGYLVNEPEGGYDDDEKQQAAITQLLRATGQQLSMWVPIWGPLLVDILNYSTGVDATGRRPDLSAIFSAPIRLLGTAFKSSFAAAQTQTESDIDRALTAWAAVFSFFTRVPAQNAVRTGVESWRQIKDGEFSAQQLLNPPPVDLKDYL